MVADLDNSSNEVNFNNNEQFHLGTNKRVNGIMQWDAKAFLKSGNRC